ncbi:MAG TPA: hypothetical protein DIC18_03215 [Clostridiales bacterium]|nr:hypothetical protein [Clostridiales bacterium]
MDNNEIAEIKQSTIGDLYSIRAGLSYISVLSEQYVQKQNSIGPLNQKINDKNTKIKQNQKKIVEQRGEESRLREQIVYKTETLRGKNANKDWEKAKFEEKKKEAIKKEYKSINTLELNIGLIIRFIIGFLLFAGWVAAGIVNWNDSNPAVVIGVCGAFFIWPLICLIKIFIMIHNISSQKRKVKKNHEKDDETFEKKFAKECKTMETNLNDLKRMADYARDHTDEIIEKYQKEIKEAEQGIADTKAEIENNKRDVEELRLTAKQTYKALEETYADFCHPDNWKHIDRILYYLVTGRADNLRDALNLMDRRMDAEMIASELKATSAMISGEIRRASSSISHAVALGAERICDATSTAADRISKSNDRVAAGLAESNALASANLAATSRLVSAQQLNNSLQRKANASMDELLRDYQVVNNRVHY